MTAPLQIIIELDLTEPVSGSMSSERGDPIVFTGWLECHAGMEAIYSAAKQGHGPTSQRRGPTSQNGSE